MRRILFVDDDTNILAGLKRTMRSMRHEWDMEFISEPKEALRVFEEAPFDIVVSDMKMPGMDGADVLTEVKKIAPESIRIILSGHSSPELIMKSVGPTHQYLAKPCEAETLKKTIERAYALKSLVANKDLRRLISGMGELPTMPATYQEVVACLQDPDSSLTDIGNIVSKDIGMTAKILQLVNSSFFGIASPVTSADQAATFLGLETLGTLVLGHGVFSHYKELQTGGFNIDKQWSFSSRCAALARVVARQQGAPKKMAEEAFLAGMLQDVGKLVLVTEKTEEYSKVLEQTGGQDGYGPDIERELMGATHGEVGAYLLGLWGLPDTVVEAVAFHERPSESASEEFGVLGIAHVSSRLALNDSSVDPNEPSLHVDVPFLERAGVIDCWPAWYQASQDCSDDAEDAA